MSVDSALLAQLRRMTAEETDARYSDAELQLIIEEYPMVDAEGRTPSDGVWAGDYDLNAAAARIWTEKAALLAGDYDFAADGASYSRSQAHEQTMQMARFYWSKRSMRTVVMKARAGASDA